MPPLSLRTLGLHWRRPMPTRTPRTLPLEVPVDEEKIPGYSFANFYHPDPGDVLDGRYHLKAKVGWGSSSTVWLAQEKARGWFRPDKYVAIKINVNNYSDGDAGHELAMSKHVDAANEGHWGHKLLVKAMDHFTVDSPKGPHMCLVFEPMREPLWLLRRRFGADKTTPAGLPLFKLYIRGLLYALDYLHTDCRVIHTDLKMDNVLLAFEHESVIERFVEAQLKNPMPRKLIGNRAVYLCHNDFGDVQNRHLRNMVPKIADLGLAQRGDGPEPLIHPIQPAHCHAPEVLLGTGWSYSADVWNFGILVWDLLAGRELFWTNDREYSAANHLAEMVALLGPAPQELLRREREMRHWRWSPYVPNAQGKLCNNAADYFGGPFFDDDGKFLHDDLIPLHRRLSDEVPDCIAEGDKECFLRFMGRMLRWLPESRATAKELSEDPWLFRSGV